MALVNKTFTSTTSNTEYEMQFKTLPPLMNMEYRNFILQILLPSTGIMFDNATGDGDEIFQDKKSMFKDLFSHVATMISDRKVITLFEDMLKGAMYEDPEDHQMKPLKIDEFFDNEFALMDRVFIYLLEVNFKHLFTEDGILQLLQSQTMNMALTAKE